MKNYCCVLNLISLTYFYNTSITNKYLILKKKLSVDVYAITRITSRETRRRKKITSFISPGVILANFYMQKLAAAPQTILAHTMKILCLLRHFRFLVVDLLSQYDIIFLNLTNLKKKDYFVRMQSPSIYQKTVPRRQWPRKLMGFGNENVLNT